MTAPACYCTAPATAGWLCNVHATVLRQDLEAVPEVLAQLDITITGQARQGGNSGSGERWAFNPSASGRAEDVLVVLRSAAHVAAPSHRYRYDEPVRDMVRRTVRGVRWLLAAPQVHTIAQDLHDALAEAWRVMDTASERVVYGVCSCGSQVTAPTDKEVTWCRVCGARHDVAAERTEKERAARAALQDRTGTLKEVTTWLDWAGHPVNSETVRKWVTRKKLCPVGEGTPARYRVADVVALAGITLDKARGVPS